MKIEEIKKRILEDSELSQKIEEMKEATLVDGEIHFIKKGKTIKGKYETTTVLYIPDCAICNEEVEEQCKSCGTSYQVNPNTNEMQTVRFCVEVKKNGKKLYYHVCSKHCAEQIIKKESE